MVQPAPQPINQLEELAKYNDILNKLRGSTLQTGELSEGVGTGAEKWIEIALQAMPILQALLSGRKQEQTEEIKNANTTDRTDESGSVEVCPVIQLEASGNTIKSGELSKKSIDIIVTDTGDKLKIE
jgi:hypothetical protein